MKSSSPDRVTRRKSKAQALGVHSACAFFLCESELLALCVLLPALGPSLLHGISNTLTTLRAQLAFTRTRCCSGILATLWAAGSCAASRDCCSRQQSACLLQLRYLCINLCDDTANFHVLPPIGVARFSHSILLRAVDQISEMPHSYDTEVGSHWQPISNSQGYFDRPERGFLSVVFKPVCGARMEYPGPASSSSS